MGVGEKEEMLNSLLFGEGEQNNYDGVYDYFMRWLIVSESFHWKHCLQINMTALD